MLEYNRIHLSKGIDVNKTSGSRECIICHYWCFLKIKLTFQPEICNSCHDLTRKVMSFNDVVIVSVKGNKYRIHFYYMSKDEAIIYLRNIDLLKKKNIIKHKNLLSHIKNR